ncbi:hypothetical protein DPX16_12810 [Anabarilius grahami]|uniref:Integrase zinc-binding domain-containing protein n=1 Tax=Anabarilius grahami TaxID=495550 RepID=A0A3N0Z9C2_ANAGA|nr:hypothetical protein DPX16_12810 [Anabarilius grahami]
MLSLYVEFGLVVTFVLSLIHPCIFHCEWAKVIRAIAHNLKLQAEDARRNQAQTQHHHDQRLVEIQDQRWTADESKPELQEELQRLQKALAELHLEVEHRELLEKVSREELTGKLQHSEALLAKAETELKDRHTKAMTCENQCKQAQKGVMAPKQQRDYVNELDTDLFNLPITASGLTAAPNHKRLHGINHMLRVGLNIPKHVSDDLTTPKLVMSQGQKGGKLIYAHDTPCAKHHGTRTTDETLKQVAHWPSMQQDVAEYVRGCQVCCQVQTANANHRSPLQHRGVTFPWSVNQKDWTVEHPLMLMAITDTMQGPTRGSPTEPMTAWQVTLPLHLYQPGDSSLITAYSTHQHLNKLRLQQREQLATQSQTLQTICKNWKGIVVVPCTHSFLLIETVNSMKQLFTVFQNDFAQNQLVMALMTDLL